MYNIDGFADGFYKGFQLVLQDKESKRAQRAQDLAEQRAAAADARASEQFELDKMRVKSGLLQDEEQRKTAIANRELAANRDRREEAMVPLQRRKIESDLETDKAQRAASLASSRAAGIRAETEQMELDQAKELRDLKNAAIRIKTYQRYKSPEIDQGIALLATKGPQAVSPQVLTAIGNIVAAPELEDPVGKPISEDTAKRYGIPSGSLIGKMDITPEMYGKGDKLIPVLQITTVDPVTKKVNGTYKSVFTKNRSTDPEDTVQGMDMQKLVVMATKGLPAAQQFVDNLMEAGLPPEQISQMIDEQLASMGKRKESWVPIGNGMIMNSATGERTQAYDPNAKEVVRQGLKSDPEMAMEMARELLKQTQPGNPETGEAQPQQQYPIVTVKYKDGTTGKAYKTPEGLVKID